MGAVIQAWGSQGEGGECRGSRAEAGHWARCLAKVWRQRGADPATKASSSESLSSWPADQFLINPLLTPAVGSPVLLPLFYREAWYVTCSVILLNSDVIS